MGERSRNEVSPQLLDLISNEREWQMNRNEGKSSEERKLELRLGPPGEDWSLNDKMKKGNTEERDESLLSLGYLSTLPHAIMSSNNGFQSHNISTSDTPCGAMLPCPWASTGYQQGNKASSFLQFPSSQPVMGKDSSQTCCPKVVELQNGDKKVFSPSSANTAVPNSSQKRTAPGPVVGWPPIRSFRKNLASSSTSKPPPECQHQHDKVAGKKSVENYGKGLFVKINMDGVPIGRKVDLNAYDSYENLSSAVDELFSGLLAAQRDSSAGGVHNKQEDEKTITGLMDGSGEYTLVYEDNEGDRMLVGDVPWHMFVSTVKRLRVLKSSELSAFTRGSKQDKVSLDSAMK
ncbi:auxin-responsive protein IAA26-like [Gastrolobium bilobum]|uniref:auxin-responsive protein IAA26-like n=1 Tax=Gastrolobium bilobum TaxID=150636 RepID=UPI002AB1B516|nr:auxin-responsive protein IAA26-like [Gastrolobium bilobum]